MKLRYSPTSDRRSTAITVADENTIIIDGEPYELDPGDVAWPKIREQTGGAIIEATRDDQGTLCLVILRRYTKGESLDWDDGQYHEVTA